MGNVNLPTPVALAGGGLCLLAGYLLGMVAGPDSPSRATGTVVSFDDDTGRLCLRGEEVDGVEGQEPDGRLCGTWRRTEGNEATPEPGDDFRFVSVLVDQPPEDTEEPDPRTVIYGDVVG